ncbi:hypothetical protein COV61_03685 [Candidatus Micrarchaeota archaeon CG11_big_fil_rev_8_21_14_0_20_47_5]|nr:MAG: hypothetical protein AUJ17_04490 [Candidatus Micrarchaeota archaeon CG1_02_47_40]PIN83233.1 MAG: hypothetical protein COV61_03685 [Candidatus Micrarchaeota archaeon CG11_big_fil_rev_8_21_14_0_20_47_5]
MKKYAIAGKNESVPKAIKPRFFQRMLKSKNLRNLTVAGAIGLGVLLPITVNIPKIFTNPKTAVSITNVFGEEPWGGYKIAPLQEQYKGKNGVMGWISPLAGTTTIMTNILDITTKPLDLKQLGIERFSENAKIVEGIEAKGYKYYIVMDVGMKGLIVVGVSNESDTTYYGAPLEIMVGTISSDLVPPLPANYTFDKAERNGVFAFVTTTALVVISDKKGEIRCSLDPTESYPLPVNPKVNITSLGEVVVSDPNWKKPAVIRILDNGEVQTYDQPLAAVYPK